MTPIYSKEIKKSRKKLEKNQKKEFLFSKIKNKDDNENMPILKRQLG